MAQFGSHRDRGRAALAHSRNVQSRRRSLLLEKLEDRALLAVYNYPYGAEWSDTGEYMLGDVAVNVVLMESNPALAPYDSDPQVGLSAPAENWTAGTIAAVKSNISAGIQWWKDTLYNVFPNAPANLLNFHINWQYADAPVATGYEPIARDWDEFYEFGSGTVASVTSATQIRGSNSLSPIDDFYTGQEIYFTSGPIAGQHSRVLDYDGATHTFTFAADSFSSAPTAGNSFSLIHGWMYDFLGHAGFNETGNFSTDIRSYNDYTRQVAKSDWAFTIFVVNDELDTDNQFPESSLFKQAFAFPGGRFMVVPASRPARTYAHEAGHQFYALDQYAGGGSYDSLRGYYNTQNLNAANNPAPGFVQANSIMAQDLEYPNANPPRPPNPLMTNAYSNHTSDPYALAQIGWQDSDNDGIFDVLDVPFSLSGSGQFNPTTGVYKFTGSTVVGTLNNVNSAGSGNDITINQINLVEASINNGPWQPVQTFPSRTYETSLNIELGLGTAPGVYDIRLRSADLRTGIKSNIFWDDVEIASSAPPAIGGVVFRDMNSNARQNLGEPAYPDIGIEVLDQDYNELDFEHEVEPSDPEYSAGTVLNNVAADEGVTLSALIISSSGTTNGDVIARSGSGMVFGTSSTNLWNDTRKLRVDFNQPVSSVNLRAIAGGTGSSLARLEAYSASGVLLTRQNSGSLAAGSQTLTVVRAAGDIKYVIAYGRLGTSAMLDSLTWGPSTSPTSGPLGTYSLYGLPDGTYRVRVTAPASHVITTPPLGYATVTVSNGQSQGLVDFGIAPERNHRFHNLESSHNVNNDPNLRITAGDALTVINFINAGFRVEGEAGSNFNPTVIGFVDVDNNGMCTAHDALMVINLINAGLVYGEGEQALAPPPANGYAADSFSEATYALASANPADFTTGGPEGETISVVIPQTPAEYFAQFKREIVSLRGDEEPCSCHVCAGSRTDDALAELQSSSSAADRPAQDSLETLVETKRNSRQPARSDRSPLLLDAASSSSKRRPRPVLATVNSQVKVEGSASEKQDASFADAVDALLASSNSHSDAD